MALPFVTALSVQARSLPVFGFPQTQSKFYPYNFFLPHIINIPTVSYRLLLDFPSMTFDLTLAADYLDEAVCEGSMYA